MAPPRLPYPKRCDTIARRSHRQFLVVAITVAGSFLAWSNWTEIDKVKRGAGRVIPQTQNQVVQHFEGGIVTEILVKEGDTVEKGRPLLRVENSFSQAELMQSKLDIRAKKIRLARLDAELGGKEAFEAPPDLAEGIDTIVSDERAIFETRRKVLAEQLGILDEQVKQKQLDLSTLRARWANTTGERKLVVDQVESFRKLAAIGALSNNELLSNERALQQIEARLSDLTHDIPRTQSELAELDRRKTEARLHMRSDVDKERSDTEIEIAKLEQGVVAMSDRSTRSDVLAPISGTVNKLYVTTVGGVVKSGEPLAQIVPADASIAVEARLSPSDRAEIWPGLPAVVKISAYDFSVYGGLKGKITEISPDALQDERGQPYFRVRLEASSADFGPQRPVVPGMVADVDILAGRQTIMDALLRPARLIHENALRL